MTIQVIPEEIHAAARHIEAAAEVVHDQIPAQVEGLDAAMPGSLSGPTATKLADAGRRRFVSWTHAAKHQGKQMHTSAKNWVDVDQTIAAHGQRVINELKGLDRW